jgi:hypothetical protein
MPRRHPKTNITVQTKAAGKVITSENIRAMTKANAATLNP